MKCLWRCRNTSERIPRQESPELRRVPTRPQVHESRLAVLPLAGEAEEGGELRAALALVVRDAPGVVALDARDLAPLVGEAAHAPTDIRAVEAGGLAEGGDPGEAGRGSCGSRRSPRGRASPPSRTKMWIRPSRAPSGSGFAAGRSLNGMR